MSYCQAGRPSAQFFADALSYNQTLANQETREQLLTCASGAVLGAGSSEETKQAFYTLSLQEVKKQIDATPLDARIYAISGTYFNNLADWQSSTAVLEKANELSPNKQTIIFELAANYMNTNKPKEALALLKKAYESATDNTTAKQAYAAALLLNGDEAKAKELFGSEDFATDPRIINIYVKLKQYDRVLSAYKTLVAKNPDNPQYYASLAATYLEMGDRAGAIAELELMKTKFASLKSQIDAAIEQVRAQK